MTSPRLTRFPLHQLVPGRVSRLRERLAELLWEDLGPLETQVGPVNAEHQPIGEAHRQAFRSCRPGNYFAPADALWGQCWFRVEIPSPQEGQEGRRVLRWDGRGEITAYLDGAPWAGLDVAHLYCTLPDRSCTLFLDCGLYQTAIWHPGTEPDEWGFRFEDARLQLRNEVAWRTWHDLDVMVQLLDRLLEEEGYEGERHSHRYKTPLREISPLLRKLLFDLNRACDVMDGEGIEALGENMQQLLEGYRAERWQPSIALVGHAHLDLVWLWPEKITYRKAIHTFATVQRMMARYPSYAFSHTSPPLYEQIREHAPELFHQIEDRIAEGRWEPTGALEVESDTLMPSGEALARALSYGQRRFAALRGGRICETAWLPDVFGYAACLPQILKLGGCSSFFTTKLTWSAVTRFPHQSFLWRGSDGSEVLTHLGFTRYNGTVEVSDLIDCARAYRQSDVHDELLVPRGYGDGAGGPTEEMIERAARMADLSHSPRVAWSRVEDFFSRLEKVRDELPFYQGELYLECHRGTLTSQSRYKAAYRAAERGLQAHEAVRCVTDGSPLGFDSWRRVLFAQFHDALPGSSIREVFDELTPELEGIAARELEAASRELAREVDDGSPTIFNPLPFARRCFVEVEASRVDGQPAQLTVDGERALLSLVVPGLGAGEAETGSSGLVHASPQRLENGLVRADFDERGQLRAFAVEGVELPLEAPSGLVLYPDEPVSWDAWDVERYSLDLGESVADELDLCVVESGPVRATLEGRAGLGAASELTIRYQLWEGCPYLMVELDVDWREKHRLLKYLVRTDAKGTTARYGCPFGSVERPQVPLREVEEVQWEVAGSRWACVGDSDQSNGVALITESKYGFSCRDGVLGLSLLRAPTYPDPECDEGRHLIRFALGAHRAEFDELWLNTAAAAEALFTPALVIAGGVSYEPPFELSRLGSLVPSWVLPAEEGQGTLLRLHETMGRRGVATIEFRHEPSEVVLVDFLERELGEPERIGRKTWRLRYGPHQVLGVKFLRGGAK